MSETVSSIAPVNCLNEEKTKSVSYKNQEITFIEKGEQNEKKIILIPGTAGDARIFCRIIEPLSKKYHVYSFSHIHLKGLMNVVHAWDDLFQQLEISPPFSLLGTSVGGRIVQYYAQEYPSKIDKLILGNTYCDNKELIKKNRVPALMLKILPTKTIKNVLLKGTEKSFKGEPDFDSIMKYFATNLEKDSKNRIKIRVRWNLEKHSLPKIPKKIPKLLILSKDDPLIPPNTRKQLISYYPEAENSVFDSGGHFLYITRAEKYYSSVFDFLSRED